jgi:hypothetical protein
MNSSPASTAAVPERSPLQGSSYLARFSLASHLFAGAPIFPRFFLRLPAAVVFMGWRRGGVIGLVMATHGA